MKKKILIIEDNEKNRMLEKDLLEIAGFAILEAGDGASGMALAKKEKPDLIIMDVRLPDTGGIRATESLRLEKETRDTPIVFVTASVSEEVIKEIRNIPGTFFLAKPIDTRTFAREINRCILGESHESN
jgi:CheY-like chemotaxis protein